MRTPFMDKSPHNRRDSAGGSGSWLKHRLAQILTRSSCAAAATSDKAFVSLARANNADHHHQDEAQPPSPYFCTPCAYERPNNGRRRSRSASLVHISVDCTGGAASGRRSVYSDAPLLPQRGPSSSLPVRDGGGGKKQSRRRRSKPAARSPPSASRRHYCSTTPDDAWGRARRPRNAAYGWSSSSSSTATDDELAPFSTDDDEGGPRGEEEAETRTLFSSLSFSSDSTATSDFYYQTNNSGAVVNNNTSRTRRGGTATTGPAPLRRGALPRSTGGGVPAAPTRTDAFFRPLISVEAKERKHGEARTKKKHGGGYTDTRKNNNSEEKNGATAVNKKQVTTGAKDEEEQADEARAGTAVVKRSSNPYADFRSSMVEMVVERRIGSVEQMEELLGSYLSLNSPRHHPAILAAFEDVWEAVFGEE